MPILSKATHFFNLWCSKIYATAVMCMTQVWASGAICFNANPKSPTSKFLSFKRGKYLPVASVMVWVNDQVKTCFQTPHEMERQLLKLKNFCFQPHNEQETNQMESTVQKYKINSKDGTKTKYLETKYTQQQSWKKVKSKQQ